MKQTIFAALLLIITNSIYGQCKACPDGLKFVRADYDGAALRVTDKSEYFTLCEENSSTGRYLGYQPYYTKSAKIACKKLTFIKISTSSDADDYLIQMNDPTKIFWLNWQRSEAGNFVQLLLFDAKTFKELSRKIYKEQ